MDGQWKLILIFAAASSVAEAQQIVPVVPSVSDGRAFRYSVAGDVEKPQTYQFDNSARVHVLDLVSTAGIIEPGNALILRGAPLTAVSSEAVDPRSPQRGSLLSPGDIVIFHSVSGMIPGRPNACVLVGGYRAVLPLSRGYRSVSDLLNQCGLPAKQQISVTRSGKESVAAFQLSGNHDIQHADVLGDRAGSVGWSRRLLQFSTSADRRPSGRFGPRSPPGWQ